MASSTGEIYQLGILHRKMPSSMYGCIGIGYRQACRAEQGMGSGCAGAPKMAVSLVSLSADESPPLTHDPALIGSIFLRRFFPRMT